MAVLAPDLDVVRTASVFAALGHPTRLRLVTELRAGERCVCELHAGGDLSTLSRHLGVLKSAGVVADERRGKRVYYRLALPCLGALLDCLDGACGSGPDPVGGP